MTYSRDSITTQIQGALNDQSLEEDKRNGLARRKDMGRRMDDLNLKIVQEDIREIRDEIKMICQTVQRVAVQDEKIATAIFRMDTFETRLTDITNRHNLLRQSHDSCDVGAILTEVRWMKWIVMATPAFYTFIFGTLVHFMTKG
jgi:lipopolysaccharide biosynthesis protein